MLPEGTTKFDLSPLKSEDISLKRNALWVVVAVVIGLGSETAWILWSVRTKFSAGDSAWEAAGLGAILFTAFAVGYLALCIPRFLPGATSLEVGLSGVTVSYGSAKSEFFSWNDGPKLELTDYRAHPAIVAEGRAFMLSGTQMWSRRSLVSQEIIDVILDVGGKQGAVVSSREGSVLWYGRAPIFYTLDGSHGQKCPPS
jgi:hypothetical protein